MMQQFAQLMVQQTPGSSAIPGPSVMEVQQMLFCKRNQHNKNSNVNASSAEEVSVVFLELEYQGV